MFCVVDGPFELSDLLASTWMPLLQACAAKSGLCDAKNQAQALCILGQHSESYIIYFPTHFCWHNNIRCGSSQTWNKSSSKKKHTDKLDIIKIKHFFLLTPPQKLNKNPQEKKVFAYYLTDGVASIVCKRTFITQ